VFQTVFRNTADADAPVVLQYNLRDWTVFVQGTQHGLKTREDWQAEWPALKISPSAQLAFKW